MELDSEHFSLAESKMFTFSAQGDVDIELEKRASLPIPFLFFLLLSWLPVLCVGEHSVTFCPARSLEKVTPQ